MRVGELGSFIPSDVIASGLGAVVVGLLWLARVVAKLSERVARLEGLLERERRPPSDERG